MFSIPDDKSPGPDGFTSAFYKAAWSVVGDDVTAAIQNFFSTGAIPKVLNSTLLTLIPKKACATNIRDFRPIACCNVLYKCITKVITRRLVDCLPEVISGSQSAFVKGRQIGDNILLAHELVNAYHLKNTTPRCTLKIDLRKAFDSVDISYLLNVMKAMEFPDQFIVWIKACLSSVMFSIGLNGGMIGYFEGKKGLRQGDPLSPALFVMAMEVLHCLFHRAAMEKLIPFHPKCKKVAITHLCFADDLLVFTNGTVAGVKGVCDVLHLFYSLSGLQLNPDKTDVFYSAAVQQSIREEISVRMGFREGKLPVRYLGVPLISGRLSNRDCDVLTARITARISGWRVKTLSYAGRLQLVTSVLTTMSQYWMSVILLPKSVIHAVEKLCSDFLWKVTDGERKKARVAWKHVALPKSEGGLGVRSLEDWNCACIFRHVWSVLMKAGSLWIAWLNHYRFKGRSFWDCTATASQSWSWRRILKVRDRIGPFVSMATEGEPLFNGKCMSKYSVGEVWAVIRNTNSKVPWYKLVWGEPTIPKHCFISWLAVNGKLVTNSMVAEWGVSVDVSCFLCDAGVDEAAHLFHGCTFGKKVRYYCWGNDELHARSWTDEVKQYNTKFTANTSAAGAGRLFWRAIISAIWYERCRRRAGELIRSPREVAMGICREIGFILR
ncbi:LINE-1 reverse transcriptase homolog [Linum grandiflorum]